MSNDEAAVLDRFRVACAGDGLAVEGALRLYNIARVRFGDAPEDAFSRVRDVDAPCSTFSPVEKGRPDGSGTCETDGHYLCSECKEIKLAVLRRRHDECEECGAKLEKPGTYGEACPNRCDVPLWVLIDEHAAQGEEGRTG